MNLYYSNTHTFPEKGCGITLTEVVHLLIVNTGFVLPKTPAKIEP